MIEHPEQSPDDEQTEVTVRLSRNSIRALDTRAAQWGVPRTWVINEALQHLAECDRIEPPR